MGLTHSSALASAWRCSISRTSLLGMPNTWMLRGRFDPAAYAAAARSAIPGPSTAGARPPLAESAVEPTGEILARISTYTRQSDRAREAFPSLVLRALKQARYDPRNLGHSWLARPAYCH